MNANHREPNDAELHAARLTAYGLGQLDEAEKAQVEAELQNAHDDREAAEAARRLAGQLFEATRRDLGGGRSAALRAAVERRLDEIETATVPPPPVKQRSWRLLALAVCLMLAAVPIYLLLAVGPGQEHARVAMDRASEPAQAKTAAPAPMLAAKEAPAAAKSEVNAAVPAEAAPMASDGAPVAFSAKPADEAARTTPVPKPWAEREAKPAATAIEKRLENSPAPASEPPAMGPRSSPEPTAPAAAPAPAAPAGSMMGAYSPGKSDLPAVRMAPGMMSGGYDNSKQSVDPGDASGFGAMMGGPGRGAGATPADPYRGMSDAPQRGKSAKARRSGDERRTAEEYPATGMGYPGGMMPGMAAPAGQGKPGKPAATYGMPGGMGGGGGGAAMGGMGGMGGPGVAPPSVKSPRARDLGRQGRPAYGVVKEQVGGQPLESDDLEEMREAPLADQSTPGAEEYQAIVENGFVPVAQQPISTFSADVDTGSYANVRRFLQEGRLPPPDAVRIEEMVNYFSYDYPQPTGGVPFSVSLDAAACPWSEGHRLVRIGLKGREIDRQQRGPSNLVFLLDVSGSMADENKLPLVKRAMMMLASQLTEDDRVAIVTYSTAAEVRMESTNGTRKEEICRTIEALHAGGSTNGSAGIQLAYEQARKNFVKKGTNRVILVTDGDLNVGITRDEDLVKLIRGERQTGVFLTVLGVGTGNLKDAKMEKLADHGNGKYAYLDGVKEAHKVLVEQMAGSLVTIAKDVKLQVEFNPQEVGAYRLLGYENRRLRTEDFDNDRKDAGDIGAGHTVTALYEIVPPGKLAAAAAPLKYQRVPEDRLTPAAKSGEVLTVSLRYKEPDGDQSRLLKFDLKDPGRRFAQASKDFQFAAAVVQFGLALRNSRFRGTGTLAAVEEIAAAALDKDPAGRRAEFLDLVRKAQRLGVK